MGAGQIFLKTSAPLSLRMNLISAGAISLDSTINGRGHHLWDGENNTVMLRNRRRQMKNDRKAGRKKKMKGKQKGEGRMENDRKEERRRQNGRLEESREKKADWRMAETWRSSRMEDERQAERRRQNGG
jgi:hypothetical protein